MQNFQIKRVSQSLHHPDMLTFEFEDELPNGSREMGMYKNQAPDAQAGDFIVFPGGEREPYFQKRSEGHG